MDAPAGWYPDPQADADERYWDGSTWTEQIRMRPTAVAQPRDAIAGAALGAAGSTNELLRQVVHEIRMVRYLIITLFVVIVVVPTFLLIVISQ
jgi:hypothetical protein